MYSSHRDVLFAKRVSSRFNNKYETETTNSNGCVLIVLKEERASEQASERALLYMRRYSSDRGKTAAVRTTAAEILTS